MLCDFDMNREPFFIPPTDKETNHGVYYMDGLHPNQNGIEVITKFETEMIQQYVLGV